MTYSINGNIVTENGTPISDAVVMVVEGTTDFPDIASLTDENGLFGISLGKGTYKLLVKKASQSKHFNLEVGVADTVRYVRWVLPD